MKAHVVGFTPWSEREMLDAMNRQLPPSKWPGDFVFVVENSRPSGEAVTTLISSAVAATPYYYTVTGNGFHHGASVFQVAAAAGLEWRWNRRAVNCMALFEHCLQDDTLHSDIRRVPACSRLTFENNSLRIELDPAVLDSFTAPEDIHSDELAQITIDVFSEMTRGREVAVSLSAGYDSRALLALALNAGMQPVIGTMGTAGSTDMKVAAKITAALGLEHRCIEINARDYMKHAANIIRVTSGVKSAAHWHTYLYASQIGFPQDRLHLVGSNGEIARTYFLDKGIAALGANCIGSFLRMLFFNAKFGAQRKLPSLDLKSFLLPAELDDITKSLAAANSSISQGSGLLRPLDEFYTMQRVRHFIGGGLAAFNSVMQATSPFLDSRFVTGAARLRRQYKMNSRFHRQLIRRCSPELLDFPTDDTQTTMASQDRLLYWLRRYPNTSYSPLGEFLQSPEVEEIVLESPHLEQFMLRKDRAVVLINRQQQFLCFLVTMHMVCEEVRSSVSISI